jgi:hypothetical protein
MVSRQTERFGGLFIATIGAMLTSWNWYMAISAGHFYVKAAMIGPAVTIIPHSASRRDNFIIKIEGNPSQQAKR